ncbi:hypothetical protein BDZ91DRAFT_688639 [Kalaharituber pfeilii]|nr:hypothetical protein BDZ91DRAFT_688639 [Kalaharituber pfeilii]
MASTLAQQLQHIATKSANTVSAEKQKAVYSVSLLYPPAHAARQDIDTIYFIALEGFQELVELDPVFSKFEKGIFSRSSIGVDRFIQTKQQNEGLDKNIEEFLGLVGPRLLLKGALKALEWLVRRFRIHEQNTTVLILTFLPYHGHPVFTRVMSIIPPKSLPITLSFLSPHLQPPSCLPRVIIIKSLTTHPGFFNLLTSYVLSALSRRHLHHALISFYIAVTAEALNRMCTLSTYRKNPQDIVIKVMPVLIEGLKAKRVPEFQIGCYMIITVLVAKLPLESTFLDSLMSAVVQGWSKESISPALACVALLAQERKSEKPLPIEVVKGLSSIEGLGQMLVGIGQKYRSDELAAGLAIGILRQRCALTLGEVKLVERILLDVSLPISRRRDVFLEFLKVVAKIDFDDEEVRTAVADFLVGLAEGTHGAHHVGKILQDLMQAEGFDIEALELRLQSVIKPSTVAIEAPIEDLAKFEKGEKQDLKTTFKGILTSIPQSSTESSFLTPYTSQLFPQLSRAFLCATMFTSDSEMQQLFSLPLFAKKKVNDPFTLSFLIKIWTSKTTPVLARAAALAKANQIIKSSITSHIRVDYQALLPYILIALADQSKKVRAEACNVMLSLNSSLNYVETSRKKDKSTPTEIWGFDNLFGASTNETAMAKWMESTEARKVVAGLGIIGVLEEVVVDKTVVHRTVSHSMGRHGEGMKNSLKSVAMAFLSSHVLGVSDLSIKLELLRLINVITSGAASKAKPTAELVKQWVAVDDYNILVEKCAQENIDITDFEKNIANAIGKADKSQGVELLVSIINGEFGIHPNQIGGMRKIACLRLQEIWDPLKAEVKTYAAQTLLDIGVTKDEEADIVGEAMDVLKKISIPMEVFERWLQEILVSLKNWTAKLGHGLISTSEQGQPKQKRTKAGDSSGTHHNESEINDVVDRLTVVLELLEPREVGEKEVDLLKVGFGVLGEVMNVAGEIGVSVGYLLQLILGILANIVNFIKTSKDPQRRLNDSIRADLLVNCIRSTQSPQVQNRALLLVAALADVAPEVVLHSVMPIFTFMGANVLRQDDEYSAYVIEQTVERVIPPLVESLHKQTKAPSGVDVIRGVAELLSSFATAYKHIPVHRRSRLFIKLTDTLGAGEFLFVIVSMLAERYLNIEQLGDLRSHVKEQEIVTFCKGIVGAFKEEIQLLSVVSYLNIVTDVLNPQPKGISKCIFDIKDGTTDISITMAQKLLWMLAAVLDTGKLRAQVIRKLQESDMDSQRLRTHFLNALETVLAIGNQYSNTRLQSAIGAVLENLLSLLTTPEFVKVIESLITESQFRQSALATFKDRVVSEPRTDSASRNAILNLIPKIASLLRSENASNELKADVLSCISAVTARHGKREPGIIFGLTETVVGDGALRNADDGLRVMALVCLADMTGCLGGRILPVVPKTVPFSLELLEKGGKGMNSTRLIHNAVFAFLEALVSIIPSFMASYLQKIMKGAWATTVQVEGDESGEESDEEEVATISLTQSLRTSLLDTIAQKMDVKSVMNAMAATWNNAIEIGYPAAREHLATVKSLLSTANKSQIQKMTPLLTSFFLQAFDLRKQVYEKKTGVNIDEEELEEIEELSLRTALQMVLKLNDTIFKPMFVKFSDWAADDYRDSEEEGDKDAMVQRSITFYSWLNMLSENLKSLITDYYSFVLTPSIALLTTVLSTKGTPSPHTLKTYIIIIQSLTTSFSSDSRDFWTAHTHFSQISTPLLAQLTNAHLSPSLLTPVLTKAIVELASACSSTEDQLKTINASVLKHMRSETAEVRMAAVKTEMALYSKLGDEWLPMLPETVPYIAELLEDDDEDIERETQRLIKKVEEFLGEGELEAMLT